MKKLLLIASSLNQLVCLKELSENLKEYQCSYRPIFLDASFFKKKRTWVSLISHKIKDREQDQHIKAYCNLHQLRIDGDEPSIIYDLAVSYHDEPVTENFPHIGTICVEEINSPSKSKIVLQSLRFLWLRFRRFYRNSAYRFDVYCVNSENKKKQLNQSGICADKILILEQTRWASQIGDICRNYLELAVVSQKSHHLLKRARIEYLLRLYP